MCDGVSVVAPDALSEVHSAVVVRQGVSIQGSTRLVAGEDGCLYGTSASHPESIFEFSPNRGRVRILRSLAPATGGLTGIASELLSTDATLFGTTAGGGSTERGTMFRMNKDGSGFAVLRSFGSEAGDGTSPLGALTMVADGAIFGTTFYGGAGLGGVLFRIRGDGNGYEIVHHFGKERLDGVNPRAGMVTGPDSSLYGTTIHGGAFRAECVFRFDPEGGDYFKKPVFRNSP